MNKKIFALACALSFVSILKAANDIRYAIDELNVDEVRLLLKQGLTRERKEALLQDIHGVVHTYKEKAKSLANSMPDLIKVIVGGALGIGGIFTAIGGFCNATMTEEGWKKLWENAEFRNKATSVYKETSESLKEFKHHNAIFGSICAVVGILGGWLFSKGWRMQAAHRDLEKAQEIERIIEAAQLI